MSIMVHLTKIGNSRGVRIPRSILNQVDLEGELELVVQDGVLIIRPVSSPRQGWEASFEGGEKNALADTELSEPLVENTFDDQEWTW